MSGRTGRWLDWFRQRRARMPAESLPQRGSKLPNEIAAEFSTEELMEFLEGDLYPTQADPVFKERLREDLKKLVRSRYGTPNVDDDN